MRRSRSEAGDGIVSMPEQHLRQDFRIYIIIPIRNLRQILWKHAGGMKDDTGRDHRKNSADG